MSRRAAATATPDVAISSSSADSQASSPRPSRSRRPRSRERMLVAAEAPGMGRVEAEHQTVEEPAAPARPFDEQPVHLRRQPRQGDMLGQGDLAPDGMAVDPDQTPLGRAFGRRRRGRCRYRPGRTGFRRGRRPPSRRPGLPPPSAADPLHVGQLGAAQAAAGRQEADGFQQVGLAGAVRAGQHDGPRVGVRAARPRSSGTASG